MDIKSLPRESSKLKPYLSEILCRERIQLGLTQVEFAHKIGVGLKTIRKIEQGDLSVNFKKLKYIFNALGLDLIATDLVTTPIELKQKLDKKEILSILSNIYSVFKIKYGISQLALFGSYATDEADLNSDIDILINSESKISLEEEGEMKLILETLLHGKEVDLTFKKNLRPEFKNAILENKIDVQEKL